MASSTLVSSVIKRSTPIFDAVALSGVEVIAQGVSLADDGSWSAIVVTPDVELKGPLTTARRVYESLDLTAIDVEHLSLEGPGSERAQRITQAPIGFPQTDDEDGTTYVAIWRAGPESPRFENQVVTAVQLHLEQLGFQVQRKTRDVGADLIASRNALTLQIEVKRAQANRLANVIRDAAGLANLSSIPTILVLITSVPIDAELLALRGLVPVRLVDWTHGGPSGLSDALRDIEKSIAAA